MIPHRATQWVTFFSMLIILMTHQSSSSLDWTLASAQLPDGSGTTCAAYIWYNDALYFYGGLDGDSPWSDPYNWVENGYKWDPVNDISTFTPFPQPPTTLKTCSWGSPNAAVIDEIMYIYNDYTPELVQFDLASFDWISGTIPVQDADNQADLGFRGCMVSDGTYLYVIGAYLVPHIRRYNPSTNTWLSSNSGGMSAYMPGPCLGMQCTYHNNKIYHFGCSAPDGRLKTIYIYDISSDTWSLSSETLLEGVISTPDIVDHTRQKAYIIGGTTGGYDNQNKVQIYDIPSNTISHDYDSDLPEDLSGSMGGFVDDTIYLLGGVSYRTATAGIYSAPVTSSPTDESTSSPSATGASPSPITAGIPTPSSTETYIAVQTNFTGFTMRREMGCDAQNSEVHQDITLQQCFEACSDLYDCKSFEYFADHTTMETTVCQTSTTCTLDQAVPQEGYGPIYFYTLLEETCDTNTLWIKKEENKHNCNDGYEDAENPDCCQPCRDGYVGTSGRCDNECDWGQEPNDKRDECVLSSKIDWLIILCTVGPVVTGSVIYVLSLAAEKKKLCWAKGKCLYKEAPNSNVPTVVPNPAGNQTSTNKDGQI